MLPNAPWQILQGKQSTHLHTQFLINICSDEKIVCLHFVFTFNKHPRKGAFSTHCFLWTTNFYSSWEKITFKIIDLSICTSPENLSTSAVLTQIQSWAALGRWPATSLQHCPNTFTHRIFLLNHLQPRKFAEIVWWVILNTHTQKNHQLLQNQNEARNGYIYEVIVLKHFFLSCQFCFSKLWVSTDSPSWRLSGRVTYPAPDGYKYFFCSVAKEPWRFMATGLSC